MTPQTRIVTLSRHAASRLVNELDRLQEREPMAIDVMDAVQSQFPPGYLDVALSYDEAVYTLNLPADFATFVETVLARIGEQWTVDIGQPVSDDEADEPWRRLADSSEAAWYDEIEGKKQ